MRKILPIIVVGFLFMSGIVAAGITFEKTDDNEMKLVEKENISTMSFSTLNIEENDDEYISISLSDASSYLTNPGQPMLPKVVKTFELPFGVKNIDVEVATKNIQEVEVTGEICPAPTPVLLTVNEDISSGEAVKDEQIYTSNELFPSDSFTYKIGCGLNSENERVTFVNVQIYPVRYIPVENKMYVADSADISITYDQPEASIFKTSTEYDMVIIAPSIFKRQLEELVTHKNYMGVKTFLMTTEEIYDEFDGADKPEQIKYFIKHAIEEYGITYVLLVGGLKNIFWAKPRDDANQGSRDWHVPVRYNNLYDNPQFPLDSDDPVHDPGCLTDLYYADVYRYNETSEEYEFESWNPNGDDYFAAWRHPTAENDTDLDYYPDVSLGRLACRNLLEVKNVVDKIITYETSQLCSRWFEKMIVVGGDGFLDQERLEIVWDTKDLPIKGTYTIYAQSTNEDGISGPIDKVEVTVDKVKDSKITFNHDDHLLIDDFPSYPARPIATITSPSPGDILGKTNVSFKPTDKEAYLNERLGWADVDYIDEVMYIRGKSYDPQPYGVTTDMHVWIEDEEGEIVFDQWTYDLEMYYEGEWVTGERLLNGGGGALYYMPEEFERELLWASNGNLEGQNDVIKAINKGAGFVFFSGHGSPNVWANHFPGVPGNRAHGDVLGLKVTGLKIYPPFISLPVYPMNKLKNNNKLPVVVVGGCHNAMFNISMIPCFLDFKNKHSMHTYGSAAPECFCWYLVKLKNRGAIASIGNTGYGYGVPGEDCTTLGLDGGICIEFFKQYGTNGYTVLGDAYKETQIAYINQFDMNFMDHAKSLTQWVLFGDPSLMIGGYE